MSTIRKIVIALCVVAGVSGYLSLRGTATEESQPAQTTRAQPAKFAASNQAVGRRPEQVPDLRVPNKVTGSAFEPGASDLTPPSMPLVEIIESLNAAIGPEGEYVDPAALAAVMRTDPELGRLVNE